MPYDPQQAQALINASAAFRMHPGGELATKLCEQLEGVGESISNAEGRATTSELAVTFAKKNLETEKEASSAYRDETACFSDLVASLKLIATTTKGKAKAIAEEVLTSAGIEITTK